MLENGRRFIKNAMILGTPIFLFIWLPIHILKCIWPSFLPYNVKYSYTHNESVIEWCMLSLLLFQVILPALSEQTHTLYLLKLGIHYWCFAVSYFLKLTSYLLGDRQVPQPDIAPIPPAANLEAVHEELEDLMRRVEPVPFQPYTRPDHFALRLIVLLIVMVLSLVLISLSIITIPVWLGRLVLSFCPVLLPGTLKPFERYNIHELYTATCGIYICWLSVKAYRFGIVWMTDPRSFSSKLKFWLQISSKATLALIVLQGIIPVLLGFLFELVFIIPLRVSLNQTPVICTCECWTLGVFFFKAVCIIILRILDCKLRPPIQRIYSEGYFRLDLKLMMKDLAIPVIAVLSLFLAVPYVIAHSFVPLVIKNKILRSNIARQIYPTLMVSIFAYKYMMMMFKNQMRQFKRVYENIKNNKYLVGREVVNYNHTSPS